MTVANERMPDDIIERAKRIRLLALDVDGVMTDGSIIYTDEGTEIKAFDVKDGHGLKLLMRSGIRTAIITGRSSRVVGHRAANLGIDLVMQGRPDKLTAFNELLAKTGIGAGEAAYMGDELVDIPVFRVAGLALSVADAVQEAKDSAHYVTARPGGKGAVREAVELILKVQGKWDGIISPYVR